MSLLRFQACNHPQQLTRDDVDDRRTRRDFFDPLHARWGFTVDAAASAKNALLPRFWTRETNALVQPWRNERVWCNPPFSGIAPWIEKAWREMRDGGCLLVVMLLPANRCEQKWWQEHIEPFREGERNGIRLTTRFLAKRMRFDHPTGWVGPTKGDRPPFGCVLVTWERINE